MSSKQWKLHGYCYECGAGCENYAKCSCKVEQPKMNHGFVPTIEQTVKVDGVTLTRTQVEAALAELNKPEFRGGDRVEYDSGGLINQCIVIAGWAAKTLSDTMRPISTKDYIWVVDISNGDVFGPAPERLSHAK